MKNREKEEVRTGGKSVEKGPNGSKLAHKSRRMKKVQSLR